MYHAFIAVTSQFHSFYGRWLALIDSQWEACNFADVGEKLKCQPLFRRPLLPLPTNE